MKRTVVALMITTMLLLGAVLTSGRGSDFQVEKRHVKSIEVRNVPARNGKNVALEIAVKPPPDVKLPTGITALVDGRQVHLYDDGRWPDERAGDGLYTVAGATKNGDALREKLTLRLPSSGTFEHHAAVPAECTVRVVDCPASCESVLFRSKCVVCFKIENCEFKFSF